MDDILFKVFEFSVVEIDRSSELDNDDDGRLFRTPLDTNSFANARLSSINKEFKSDSDGARGTIGINTDDTSSSLTSPANVETRPNPYRNDKTNQL